MDPGLPTDRFYTELGEFLEQTDGYHHLRTTSTWGPSAKDCRHPKLDLADVHFYLRPSDSSRLVDEVEAVLDRSRWLRAQAPGKPAHLGEFGLANEKWQPTEEMKQSPELIDVHNALWASAMSGTCGTVLYWWWDRLDPREVYPLYEPLSRFLREVPWTTGRIQPITGDCADPRIRALGLTAGDRAWLWVFCREASWANSVVRGQAPGEVLGANVQLPGLAPGRYRLRWWDTRTGSVVEGREVTTADGILEVVVPAFQGDLACQVLPGS
jgi:hypothetical protein